MDVAELKKLQKEFDEKHVGLCENKPEDLLFLAVALAGEVGEFANIVKKYYRKEKMKKEVASDKDRDYLDEMKKEIIDVFCYFLITAYTLNIDIEKEFLANLEKNKKRFS